MPIDALALVLGGALIHATWNLFAKRAGGGAAFIFLVCMVSSVVCAPFAIAAWIWQPARFSSGITSAMWLAMAVSAAVHVAYFYALQRGYREADYSVVYPMARGTGPLFSVLGAVVLLHETPGLRGTIGIVLLILGIFVMAGAASLVPMKGKTADAKTLPGVLWGATTGGFIAVYTVVDGWAIKVLGMVPVVFYPISVAMRALLQAPFIWPQRGGLAAEWQKNHNNILIVGCLSPLAYVMALHALQRAPLSYVAPLRELSMLIAAFFGAWLLKEKLTPSRIAGTLLMLLGVWLLVGA